MKYIASALFFGVWAFLFQFYMPQSFDLYLYPRGGEGEVSRPTAWWMFLPLALGIYLFVVAEIERIRRKGSRRDAGE